MLKEFIIALLIEDHLIMDDLPAVDDEAVNMSDKDFIEEAYKDKMKKKLYGLLREREKDGEWEKFLDTILIELSGYSNESKTIEYYTLYAKLSSCRYLSFKYYRKTIFECMNLFDTLRIDVI